MDTNYQTKLSKITNLILIIAALLLVFYAWSLKIFKSPILSILISASLVTIVATEIIHFRKKRDNRLNLKAQELKFKDAVMFYFLTSPETENVKFFKAILTPNFTFEKTNKFLFDKQKQTLIVVAFNQTEIDEQTQLSAIKLARSKNAKSLFILCNSAKKCDFNPKNTGNYPHITILNNYEIFALLKEKNTFPIPKTEATLRKRRTHQLTLSNLFRRINFKPFLLCGLFLYISAFIVPYFKIYYITMASFSLLFAAICLIFAPNPQATPTYTTLLSTKKQPPQ